MTSRWTPDHVYVEAYGWIWINYKSTWYLGIVLWRHKTWVHCCLLLASYLPVTTDDPSLLESEVTHRCSSPKRIDQLVPAPTVSDIKRTVSRWMSHYFSDMFAAFNKLKDRAEKFLNEKNFVTDCLSKVEEWTGIKKRYLAIGMSFLWQDELKLIFRWAKCLSWKYIFFPLH